jgi:membrane associated rhomboid family serine protease
MGYQDRSYNRSSSGVFAPEWTAVTAIIAVNIAVWLLNFIGTAGLLPVRFSLNDIGALRSDLPQHMLTHFWQLLTYGFLHDGPSLLRPHPFSPLHLLFNMLTLWFFGREAEAILGRAEFVRFYCLSIVLAGLTWVVAMRLGGNVGFPIQLVGASGGVMAVLALFIWYYPQETLLLWGVLPVPAWALGVLYLVFDLQGVASGGDRVAHTAHLAGATFGLLYAWRGWSLEGVATLPASWFRRPPRMRVVRPDDDDNVADADRSPDADEVDRILAKISRSGEASLTPAERETLTRASRRLRERSR